VSTLVLPKKMWIDNHWVSFAEEIQKAIESSAHSWFCACRCQTFASKMSFYTVLRRGDVVPNPSHGVEHHIYTGGHSQFLQKPTAWPWKTLNCQVKGKNLKSGISCPDRTKAYSTIPLLGISNLLKWSFNKTSLYPVRYTTTFLNLNLIYM
jgi:hypothetical protein